MHPLSVPQPLDRDIRSRSGVRETFPVALSRGIERSGMSLEQVQRRLQAQGLKVSLSTLSYWRRGRTRPERPDSLRAVGIIEEILGIPSGYLVSLLGPRKPRGRWASRVSVRSHEALWEGAEALAPILAELDEMAPHELTFLSLREQHFVDEHRHDSMTKGHAVVRAETDWVRSCVVLHRAESGDRGLPVVTAASGCAIGRSRTHPASRFTVTEILLDRTLRIGETAAFSYDVRWFGGEPSSRFSRAMRHGAKEYLLEIVFHPDAVPVACHEFHQHSARLPEIVQDELRLGSFHSVHLLTHEPKMAIMGIRWQW